ncbi:hypothetical protein FACS18949_10820 [Clostridia bacterium]|nr:hypothetical protein FACS18949_10820 [Clostridia bacterium]
MPKEKHVPLRMCLACRQMKPKAELFALQKPNTGRHVYICKNPDCVKRARKIRAAERAFSAKIEPEVYENLERELKLGGQMAEPVPQGGGG